MATYVKYADVSQEVLDEYPTGLNVGGRLHICYAKWTIVAADIADTVLELEMPRLLPGKVMILSPLCWMSSSDMDANADLHIGYRATVDYTGTAVVADDNYWMDNADIGGGALQGLFPAVTGVTTAGAQPVVIDAQTGLQVVVMIDTAMPNATDVVECLIVYAHID